LRSVHFFLFLGPYSTTHFAACMDPMHAVCSDTVLVLSGFGCQSDEF
jgi:hypothetical protein